MTHPPEDITITGWRDLLRHLQPVLWLLFGLSYISFMEGVLQ